MLPEPDCPRFHFLRRRNREQFEPAACAGIAHAHAPLRASHELLRQMQLHRRDLLEGTDCLRNRVAGDDTIARKHVAGVQKKAHRDGLFALLLR